MSHLGVLTFKAWKMRSFQLFISIFKFVFFQEKLEHGDHVKFSSWVIIIIIIIIIIFFITTTTTTTST